MIRWIKSCFKPPRREDCRFHDYEYWPEGGDGSWVCENPKNNSRYYGRERRGVRCGPRGRLFEKKEKLLVGIDMAKGESTTVIGRFDKDGRFHIVEPKGKP